MAVPKRKISKARRNKRRSHLRSGGSQVSKCSHCKQPKVAHRVCPHCGYYAGVEILEEEE